MNNTKPKSFLPDIFSGISVFLVAIPLCLGISLASGVPLVSGLISGIMGGIVVGAISKSSVSVSGPAAGLVTVIIASISQLGTFEAFVLTVALAGLIQIFIGIMKMGTISDYVPLSVIKGLLAAIGIVIIMKQLPHLFGYDTDYEGDFSFFQYDGGNSISSIFSLTGHIHLIPSIVGIFSIILMVFWNKIPYKKIANIPSPLIVVLVGVGISEMLIKLFPDFTIANIDGEHFVNVPVITNLASIKEIVTFPDFSNLLNSKVYIVAFTIAVIASLETILNIDAADKIDPKRRYTDGNRELIAQGFGNFFSGLCGGLPVTSVIVRTSININSGAKSKLSTIIHGLLLLMSVVLIPNILNKIPLACLAGILIVTGMKLVKFSIIKEMYHRGFSQFVPFITTILAIIFTDLLKGVVLGLISSLMFVILEHFSNKFDPVSEKHAIGDVIRITMPEKVSFLNKSSVMKILNSIPEGSKLVIDARYSSYIDYDILELIKEFRDIRAPIKSIKINLIGFKSSYKIDRIEDHVEFGSIVTKNIQSKLSPDDVLDLLRSGNRRFMERKYVKRDFIQQVSELSNQQHPIAAVLSCIDSRTAAEPIFDLGFGDIFSIRIAGNVVNDDILGCLEFACKVSGAKLILVLGHSDCGAVKAACDSVDIGHVTGILRKIQGAIPKEIETIHDRNSGNKKFVNNITKINVIEMRNAILNSSNIIKEMVDNKEIKITYGIYNVANGKVTFEDDPD